MNPRVLAIDPGDRHTGWATFIDNDVQAGEVDSSEAIEFVQNEVRCLRITMVVLEEFVLYPTHVANQAFSSMETSQLIGQLKLVALQLGVPWVEQGAGIKKPIRAQLRGRGIQQVGSGPHARDAELHLYNYLLRNRLISGPKP